MIDKNSTLDEILDHAWGLLGRGGADAKHPFHYPVLATFNAQNVQQRTVVLRDTRRPEGYLIAYSDIRTQKIADLRENGKANWLFYDHGNKEQIRAKGDMIIHHQDEVAQDKWEQIPPKARGDYIGPLKPGTERDTYEANLPEDFLEEPSHKNTEQGFENFCVLLSKIQVMDYLKLMKGGHLRTRFSRENDVWRKRWVAP
jgi:hypothetical protein